MSKRSKFDIFTIIIMPVLVAFLMFCIGCYGFEMITTEGISTLGIMRTIGFLAATVCGVFTYKSTLKRLLNPKSNSRFIYVSYPYSDDNAKIHKALQTKFSQQRNTIFMVPVSSNMEALKTCSEVWFCPGCETDRACWSERDYACRHGMEIRYLREDEISGGD